jgi:hypothetical protein
MGVPVTQQNSSAQCYARTTNRALAGASVLPAAESK